MPGIHGQYRETPVGCVTGTIALLLFALAGWMIYMLLTREPDPEAVKDGSLTIAYFILAGVLLVGVFLLRKSVKRLRRNLRENQIDKM
mgnify:CR=1 FL=1